MAEVNNAGQVRRGKHRFLVCCCILGAGAVGAAVFRHTREQTGSQGAVPSASLHPGRAERLYARVAGLRHEMPAARVEVARELARHPNGGPWIALLLLWSQKAPVGDKMEQEMQMGLRVFHLGLVAVALEALPKDVDAEVLWALTYLLDEKERGLWPEEIGLILKARASCGSSPIRELARTCLRDRLGTDHGWDASAWRTAILHRQSREMRQ